MICSSAIHSDRTRYSFIVLLFVSLAPVARAEKHEFNYDASSASPKPQHVNVAGDFNGWSKVATAMNDDGNGVFKATIDIPEGVHHYKFVLDNEKWINDPNSDSELEVDDGHGGKNSAVLIGPDARKLPPAAPNAINESAISYDPSDISDCNVATPMLLRLQLRTQADDVQSIAVRYSFIGSSGTKEQAMWKTGTKLGFDTWGAMIEVGNSPVQYAFQMTDGQFTNTYANGAFFKGEDNFKYYSISMDPKFETPDWAKRAVWYQIFPERFRNGDPSNDPGDKPYERLIRWQADWWKAQPGEAPGDENFYKGEGNVWKRRYGGDVQGLIEALPYLKSLGINAIYLNPMFEADSMHKYDATDYRHIDDNFGTRGDVEQAWKTETDDPATWTWTPSDKLFLKFVDEAHKQGFKVILDGVFNHVGRSHWAFQDVLKNGKNSKYADWFDIRDFSQPIKYIAWDRGGEPTSDGHLPVFKKNDQTGLGDGPRNHIFAITKRWLAPDGDPTKGVDGWRLDVPGDIPHPFWIEWRKLVKQTKPDAYISGEIWDWAQPWLNNGDQFDAVMNYRFAVASQDFFVNQAKAITPSQFSSRLNQIVYAYPLQVSLVQMNLFDSHDTDRFASMFMNPDVAYDASNRKQDNGPGYNPAKPRQTEQLKQKQTVAFQMCFLGAPMTYYGDENGMWGPDDPSNRQPMVWKDKQPYDDPEVKFDDDLFAFYQRAVAVREHFTALQTGFFQPLIIDDANNVIAFARQLGDASVCVAINRSDHEQTIDVPVSRSGDYLDWLDPAQVALKATDNDRPTVEPTGGTMKYTAKDGVVTVTLKPFGAAVIAK